MFWFGGPGTIFVLIAFVFAMYAQSQVSNAYNRNSRIGNSRGLTGGLTGTDCRMCRFSRSAAD